MRYLYEWFRMTWAVAFYWFAVCCVVAICVNVWAWILYDVIRDHRRTFKKGSDEDSH